MSRAVERLREFFAKRGVTVGASGLVVVISANAVQAAPVGLAVTISTAAALAGTTLATTATATATKAIAMTTLQNPKKKPNQYKINAADFLENLNRQVKTTDEESTAGKLRKFLEQGGVTFDPLGTILFDDKKGQILVFNTLTNLDAIGRALDFPQCGKMIYLLLIRAPSRRPRVAAGVRALP